MDNQLVQPTGRGRWLHVLRRLAAYGIDLALVFAVYAVVQTFLFPFVESRFEAVSQSGWALELYVILTVSLPTWLYFILSERSSQQATLGKRLLGLKVVGVTAAAVTTGRVVFRTIGKLLPWELAHFAVNVPTNPWLEPDTELAPWRLVLVGLVYLLLIIYFVSVIRRPYQAIYDRPVDTAVVPKMATVTLIPDEQLDF